MGPYALITVISPFHVLALQRFSRQNGPGFYFHIVPSMADRAICEYDPDERQPDVNILGARRRFRRSRSPAKPPNAKHHMAAAHTTPKVCYTDMVS